MINRIAALFLTMALCAPAARADKPAFKVMHVADLVKALDSTTMPVRVYDVNVAGVREKDGIIPGAWLLSSSSKYDVAKELPADKKIPLVFYCANTMCTASHSAATRAIQAGHADVSVMVDGIEGWKKAGRQTAPAKSALNVRKPKSAPTPKSAGTPKAATTP